VKARTPSPHPAARTTAARAWATGLRGIVALAILIGLGGCEPPPATKQVSAAGGYIAVIGAAEADPLWPVFRGVAERSARGLGSQGVPVRVAAPAKGTPNAQIAAVRALQGPDMRGLCIHPVDSLMMREVLCELQTQGVAVVTMMQRIECADPLPFAGIDEVAAGKELAEVLLGLLDGAGTAVILSDASAPRSTLDRQLGFTERLNLSSGIEVQRELDCDGNAFVAARMMRDYMERFPRLDAWVALDNWPLRDLAADQRLLPAGCRLITTKPYPAYWSRLTDGTCHALVGVRYERIPEAALRMCLAQMVGEPLSTEAYLAPPLTITERNLAWFRAHWQSTCRRPEDAE
jgi:ABC-type sugar transport system substrate-binding protein